MSAYLEKTFDQIRAAYSRTWSGTSSFTQVCSQLLGYNSRRQVCWFHELTATLDDLEKVPVKFEVERGASFSKKFDKVASSGYTKLIGVMDHLLSLPPSTNVAAQDAREELIRRLFALHYRLEKENGGWNRENPSDALMKELLAKALEWKKEQFFFKDKELTSEDRVELSVLGSYKGFAVWALATPSVLRQFFDWSLVHRNPAHIFIEFPALQQAIYDAELHMKLSHFPESLLKIEKELTADGYLQKVVYIRIEGKWVNSLDRSKVVTLKGGWKLSIDQMFDVFRHKYHKIGDLEVFSTGIANWNSHKLGWYNPKEDKYEQIDLDQKKWWKQLPPLESLTTDQVNKRFSVQATGKEWVLATRSSRGSLSLDFENTHAFIEVAIPQGNGIYQIYDCGKFGLYFPSTVVEKLGVFCETQFATVAYPDETIFYHHRQHHLWGFIVPERKGLRFMRQVLSDIRRSRRHDFIYQIESENCAKWAQEKLESVTGKLPNLFIIPLLETEPSSFVRYIFNAIKKLPKWMQTYAVTRWVHNPFGAWRGQWIDDRGEKKWMSLWTHDFWQSGEVYLPSHLNSQIHNDLLPQLKSWTFSWVSRAAEYVAEVTQSFENQVVHLVEEDLHKVQRWLRRKMDLICHLEEKIAASRDSLYRRGGILPGSGHQVLSCLIIFA